MHTFLIALSVFSVLAYLIIGLYVACLINLCKIIASTIAKFFFQVRIAEKDQAISSIIMLVTILSWPFVLIFIFLRDSLRPLCSRA